MHTGLDRVFADELLGVFYAVVIDHRPEIVPRAMVDSLRQIKRVRPHDGTQFFKREMRIKIQTVTLHKNADTVVYFILEAFHLATSCLIELFAWAKTVETELFLQTNAPLLFRADPPILPANVWTLKI